MRYSGIILLLPFILTSCKEKYNGYIYDGISRKPLAGVQIYDIERKKSTSTDAQGYYSLNWDPGFLFSIKKSNYIIDTLRMNRIITGEHQVKEMDGSKRFLYPQLSGKIYDKKNSLPLKNAEIYTMSGEKIVSTDANGHFELSRFPPSDKLVLKKENYQNDTVLLFKVKDPKIQQIELLQPSKNIKFYLTPLTP